MKAQKIFNRALKHVMKQGRPALSPETPRLCMYRTNGLKCAFGCLIKDKEYDVRMEGHPARDVISEWELSRFYGHEDLIRCIQRAHDTASDHVNFLDQFIMNMRQVAQQFKLEVRA